MFTYVLIVVFLAGYGPRPDIKMQEFSTKASCLLAQAEVVDAWKRSNDSQLLNKVVCVPKNK